MDKKIEIGTPLLVFGIGWLIVDAIDPKTGLLFCYDQDGGDFEISEAQVDAIIPEYDPF